MFIFATGGFLGRLEWCIQHSFDDISVYPTPFWWYFDVSDMIWVSFFTFRPFFSWIFFKYHRRLHRNHNSEYSHKAFLIKNITFSTSKKLGSDHFSRLWHTRGPLDPSKSSSKTNIFSTFSLFGPTKPAHIPFTCAIYGFSASFFTFRLLFSWFFWKCHPRLHRKHNSEYSHKAFLIKNITFSTSKRLR